MLSRSQIQEVRAQVLRLGRRVVGVEMQAAGVGQFRDDRPGERGGFRRDRELLEGDEGRLAHLVMVRLGSAGYVRQTKDEERVVRGFRDAISDRKERTGPAEDVRLLF